MLYTEEEKLKRDSTKWTLVQGILAPIQFIFFLVSLALVINYFMTGEYATLALLSVVIKTFLLFLIMITGCLWEKAVFDCYLFAKPFYWEDVVSIFVMILHSIYLLSLFTTAFTISEKLLIALVAYFAYVINATQFLLKFRAASIQSRQVLEGVST